MRNAKKCRTGGERLHAALVENDPASIDLIFIGAAGFLPALRIPAMAARTPYPPQHCHAPPGAAHRRAGPAPCWRHPRPASNQSAVRA